MTDIDTKELRRLMDEATAGPVKWWTSNSWRRLRRDDRGIAQSIAEPYVARDGHPDLDIKQADMDFIAALWNSAPALLSEAEEAKRLREELAALRAAPTAEPASHNWVRSTLGHGDAMCSRCKITNREAAVLGCLDRCDVPEAAPPAPVADGERDRYRRAAEFAAKMAWREDPPNAHQKLTDSERLSAIKHHPDIKALAAAPTEEGRDEAQQASA